MSIQKVQGSNNVAPVSPSEMDGAEASESVGNNAEMLPSPALQELLLGGDAGAQIAAMMMMLSKTQRDSARETRKGAESAEDAAQRSELGAMRDAAEKRFEGATREAVMKGIGGACTLAAGAAEANNDKAGAGSLKGANEASTALGGYLRAERDHEAAGCDIQAKAAANTASTAKRQIDDARDLEKDAKDLMNRVMSFYKEYATSKEDAQKAALHRA